MTEEEGEELARKNGMMFIETSAKERIGVNEAFEEVVNKVLESPLVDETMLRKGSAVGSATGPTVKLGSKQTIDDYARGC